MSEIERIGGCSPDGKMDISFEKYFESLDELEAYGGELSMDESWLLAQWRNIQEGHTDSGRYAMFEYEAVMNRIGTPKSDVEKFLYDKARDGLMSLRDCDDEYVWEHLDSNY